jgi:phosphoenolpyruvate carboxykinase (ATP)
LSALGILNAGTVFWNLPSSHLYEHAVRAREGEIAHLGPLVVNTEPHTGRSPQDKFVVRDAERADTLWWGAHNNPFESTDFDGLFERLCVYLQERTLYVQDCFAGADLTYRMPIRVINELAWHNLFARNLFILPTTDELAVHAPEFTVIDMPGFHAHPTEDHTNSSVFIVINFSKRLVIIGGTAYAGEMKKSIFTVLNYLLPQRGVLPMHCSANVGMDDSVALFFGLSGTGKTTLSTDSQRPLLGDDEHGWSDTGIFNLEGGCYAKTIRLDPENEPEIHQNTRLFGTVLENVPMDPESRRLDLDSEEITENTRASYPISHMQNVVDGSVAGHPQNILFLAADAFGVLPPLSRLTTNQAIYHFLLGYTARVAGTEQDVTEPEATFSTCFSAPFLPLPPHVYAKMLSERLQQHEPRVWLVNTGWSAGQAAREGHRISLSHTRATIRAVLSGALDDVSYSTDLVFGLSVPTSCPGVPDELLDARRQWADSALYDDQAAELARLMRKAFEQHASSVSPEVLAAAPPG